MEKEIRFEDFEKELKEELKNTDNIIMFQFSKEALEKGAVKWYATIGEKVTLVNEFENNSVLHNPENDLTNKIVLCKTNGEENYIKLTENDSEKLHEDLMELYNKKITKDEFLDRFSEKYNYEEKDRAEIK